MQRHKLNLNQMGDTVKDREKELAELANIEKKIAARKAQIAKADSESKKNGPLTDLACKLHSVLCTYDHTDGCGWYYEILKGVHNWQGNAHYD